MGGYLKQQKMEKPKKSTSVVLEEIALLYFLSLVTVNFAVFCHIVSNYWLSLSLILVMAHVMARSW